MFCKDKKTNKRYWRHKWKHKTQVVRNIMFGYGYGVPVMREVSTCGRCGKKKVLILNMGYKPTGFEKWY